MMDTFDDRLDEAARALKERLPELDASLDDRVMAAIRTATPVTPATPRKPGGLRWLLEPRTVRVRPVWLAAGLAAAAALVLVFQSPGPPVPRSPVSQVADTVFVHFSLSAPSARAVALAGSFNGWEPAQLQLRRTDSGTWEATIPLPVGEHRYQFVVDGQRWVPDPAATQIDDGFGGTNSVIVVGPKGVVRS